MSFDSQRQWLGATSTGGTGLKLCHAWEWARPAGRVDFESLEDDGNAVLNVPDFLLK